MKAHVSVVAGVVLLLVTATASVAEDTSWQNAAADQTAGDSQGPTPAVPPLAELPSRFVEMQKRIAKLEVKLKNTTVRDNVGRNGGSSESRTTRSLTRGKVVVNNHTGVRQYLEVNGFVYPILPGVNAIWVNYGTVRTHLLHFKSPKVWNVSKWRYNGRNHELPISIAYP